MEKAISYAKTIEKKDDVTTLNAKTQRLMTSDLVHPEDEAATPEEAVVEDAVPTTQHALLQPSVTTVVDPTHTKEDDSSVLLTTSSATNGELLGTSLISAEVVHPHRVWKTPTEDVAAALAVEIAVEEDATYTTWSMETNSWLKRQCHSKFQPRANNAKTYTSKETVPLYSVRGKHTPKPMFMVEIDGNPEKMLGDTGAPVNIIGENVFYTLHPKPTLQPSDTTLYPYGKDRPPIALLGMFTGTLSSNYTQDDTCVYVT